MKPICVPCQRFFKPKKTGMSFIECMPLGDAKPGTAEPGKWRDYKLWKGDEWQCPECGAVIVVGVGAGPISEHYHPDYDEKVKTFTPGLRVNDC